MLPDNITTFPLSALFHFLQEKIQKLFVLFKFQPSTVGYLLSISQRKWTPLNDLLPLSHCYQIKNYIFIYIYLYFHFSLLSQGGILSPLQGSSSHLCELSPILYFVVEILHHGLFFLCCITNICFC